MGNYCSQRGLHSENCELNKNLKETILCGILKTQAFRKLEGENLDDNWLT